MKSRRLLIFERFTHIFLDFEREFYATLQERNTTFSSEIQKKEFKLLCSRVREPYEPFATGYEEDLKGDLEAARELFGHCILGYTTVASLMGELPKTLVNQAGRPPTQCLNGQDSENRIRHNKQMAIVTWRFFMGIINLGHPFATCLLLIM